MRRNLLGIGLLLSSATAFACGPSQPNTEPQTPRPVAVDADPAAAARPTYDVSPVAEPADIVGIARWKNPAATLDATAATAGVPPQMFEAGSKMAVEALLQETLRGMVDVRQFAAVVSLDASVDAVATLDPSPKRRDLMGAISIGLTSLEAAKQAAEASGPVTELSPGIWRIGARDRFENSCVIAASAGPAPARLVCSGREKDLVHLAPYMARTLPTTAAPATDLHGEIRLAPVKARYGAMLRDTLSKVPILAQGEALGEPKFDRALLEAATGLSDEVGLLVGDLDMVTLDIGLAQGGLDATGSLQMKSGKSWLAQTLTERPERAGPPPAIFWRAPKDSDSAFFSRNGDPARYTVITRTLRDLLEGVLTKQKIGSAADRKALADLLVTPTPKDANVVQASGHFAAAVDPKAAKTTPQQRLDGMAASWIGWHLVGVDDGQAALTKWLKDAVAVYNRGGLTTPLKKEMRNDAKFLPTVKTVAAPAALGAGALAVEIKFSNIPASSLPGSDLGDAKAQLTLTVHILLMADGKNTWIALGTSKDELSKRLAMVKTGAAETGTITGRAGLEALRGGANLSAGFVSLGSLTQGIPSILAGTGMDAAPEVRQLTDALKNLPHAGSTPILITTRATAGAAPRSDLAVNVPKGALEDVAAVVLHLVKTAAFGSSQGPTPVTGPVQRVP